VHDPVELGPAPDQRVELSLRGALGEVGRERRERIGGQLAGLAEALGARGHPGGTVGAFAARLRHAVRDVLEHVEARDTLRAQERHRVRLRLLEDRGEDVARVDLVLLGALAMRHRVLEHAVERERLARFVGVLAGHLLEVVAEVAVERGLERGHVGARVVQDLAAARVVDHREQEVLHRDVVVAPRERLAHGRLQHQMELSADPAHSFSAPARSG
jgi:hypothetical protein